MLIGYTLQFKPIYHKIPININNVTILIPLFNGIQFLPESIKSILNQTYTHYEVIIGINGHIPNSNIYNKAVKLTENNPQFRVIQYDTKGKSNTLNAMVKDATTHLICLLDVDDIWISTKLEKQITYINKYDVIGTLGEYFGNKKGKINIKRGEIFFKDFKQKNQIINSSVMMKKKFSYWDNIHLEDYDCWLRLSKKRVKFFNINQVLVKHRIHKKSFFNNTNNKHFTQIRNKY